MKIKSFLVLVSIIHLLISCVPDEGPTFAVKQPEGVKDESKIPKKLFGKYRSDENGALLIIDNSRISRKINFDFKMSYAELLADSSNIIIGDSIIKSIDVNDSIEIKIRREGDSVSFVDFAPMEEILFDISDTSTYSLREFKGSYFMNKLSDGGWTVKKLNLKRGILSVSSIDSIGLATLTENKEELDTINYVFKPSKKVFKNLNKRGFNEGETFKRISK